MNVLGCETTPPLTADTQPNRDYQTCLDKREVAKKVHCYPGNECELDAEEYPPCEEYMTCLETNDALRGPTNYRSSCLKVLFALHNDLLCYQPLVAPHFDFPTAMCAGVTPNLLI